MKIRMRQRSGIGFLLISTLGWSVVLGLVWYFAVPILLLNLFLTCLAVGLPAYVLGRSAVHRQARKPVLLTLAAYCGGAALAIGALQAIGRGGSADLHRVVEAFLIHLVTLTLFVPAPDGGYQLFPVNLLWLALAGMTASIAAEAAAKRSAPVRGTAGTSRASSAAPARGESTGRPRPRRRRTGRGGTGETDSS